MEKVTDSPERDFPGSDWAYEHQTKTFILSISKAEACFNSSLFDDQQG